MPKREIIKKIERDEEGNITQVREVHRDGCECTICAPVQQPAMDPGELRALRAEIEHLKRTEERNSRQVAVLEDDSAALRERVNLYEESTERNRQVLLDQRERVRLALEERREPTPEQLRVQELTDQLLALDLHERQEDLNRRGLGRR